MKRRNYFIYIIANFSDTTLYIGVTNNLDRRIFQHRQGVVNSFSKKYHLTKLVYFEEYNDIQEALIREKQLKNWHRSWKINLIKEFNPEFKNLLEDAEINSA